MATGTRATTVPVYLGQLVQNGSITTPVPFFDVGLPDGYSRFNFFFTGITVTAPGTGDNIAAALMVGGAFACDPVNNDTYYEMASATTASLMTLTPIQTDVVSDPAFRAVGLFDIYVGDANNWPVVSVTYSWAEAGLAIVVLQPLTVWTLFPSSTIIATHGAATMLRVLPKGAGDINPPTSGETINTGEWRLYAFN